MPLGEVGWGGISEGNKTGSADLILVLVVIGAMWCFKGPAPLGLGFSDLLVLKALYSPTVTLTACMAA